MSRVQRLAVVERGGDVPFGEVGRGRPEVGKTCHKVAMYKCTVVLVIGSKGAATRANATWAWRGSA